MGYYEEVMADSPVLYLRLGETSGTTAVDASASPVNGTYAGGYTLNQAGARSIPNPSVLFSGTAGTVTVPDASKLDRGNFPFTIEVWLKRASTGTVDTVVHKGNDWAKLSVDANGDISVVKRGGNVVLTVAGNLLDDGLWHHVVYVRSGEASANNTVYVDGTARANATSASRTLTSTADSLVIGHDAATGGTAWWNGGMDEFALYPTALSAARIQAHYQAGLVLTLTGGSIATTSALGAGTLVPGEARVLPGSVDPPGGQVPSPAIGFALQPPSIDPPGDQVPSPSAHMQLQPSSIDPPGGQVPAPDVLPGPVSILGGSIESGEEFGTASSLTRFIKPESIDPPAQQMPVPGVTLERAQAEDILLQERRLAALLAGKRGGVETEIIAYESNISGERFDPVDGVQDLSVSMSNFRDWAWELEMPVVDNDQLNPDTEYVLAVMSMRVAGNRSADAETHEFPLGLYRFEPPSKSHSMITRQTLRGRSLESLLAKANQGSYVAPAGANVLTTVKNIVTSTGIPADRVKFPPVTKTFPNAVYFDVSQNPSDCYKLRIANKLLNGGGFYALYTDAEGYVTTSVIEEFAERKVDAFYTTQEGLFHQDGAGNRIHGDALVTTDDISDEEDDENFANHVIAASGDANQFPPLEVHLKNNDPNSKYSIPNLGYTVTDDPITVQGVVSRVELEAIARAALERASGRYRRVQFKTIPDPRRGLRESYLLYFKLPNGDQVVLGKWRVIGWEISRDGMQHEVARVETGEPELFTLAANGEAIRVGE